jgi:uncharacterized membrane protein
MVSSIQIKKEITMDNFLKKIVWLIIIAPAIYLAIVWNNLPKKIAMHFNLKGVPNGYGSRSDLILVTALLTVVATAIFLLLPLAYKIDTKKSAAENKTRLLRLAFAITLFVSFVACIVINGATHGNSGFNIRLVFGGIGLLFCIIGNYMHNIKPNYFAGIRLPWTLENEENWKKTHLLAGKLFFAGGLLIAILCLLTPVIISIILFITITIIVTIIPGVYSYRLYKKQKTLNSIS